MKTSEQYLREMEDSGILMEKEMTFTEYADDLLAFQDMVTKMIMGAKYEEGMRLDNARSWLESVGRQKGFTENTEFRNGIQNLKKIEREIAIALSGKKGEQLVSKTLEYVTRPNVSVFKNVYLSDGNEETELDDVILTDSGILILEVKKVKSDITFAADGRMLRNGNECFDNRPIAEKMHTKRRLLRKQLEAEVARRGLDISVCVDSFIVLSPPHGQFIHVKDDYRKEKYCFRSKLTERIDHYIGYAYYSEEQLETLGNILSNMEANKKRFEEGIDFDDARRSLADVLALIHSETVTVKKPIPVHANPSKSNSRGQATKYVIKALGGVAAIGACIALGFGLSRAG